MINQHAHASLSREDQVHADPKYYRFLKNTGATIANLSEKHGQRFCKEPDIICWHGCQVRHGGYDF